jgi:acetylglutamate kinase
VTSSRIVVKVGGSTVASADSTIQDLVALHSQGEPLVVIHGGGDEISRRLGEAGVAAEFIDGLRSTPPAAMPIVAEALDNVNATIAAELQSAGAQCRAFTSHDPVLVARQITSLGRVGEVNGVAEDRINAALADGAIAVIAPLAEDLDDHGLLNVNADTAAGEIAIALGARSLVFSTDVDGVRSRSGELLPLLHIDDAAVLLADGTATAGMMPKLRAAMKAAGAGIESVILDGRVPGNLLHTLCGETPQGTRIGARSPA